MANCGPDRGNSFAQRNCVGAARSRRSTHFAYRHGGYHALEKVLGTARDEIVDAVEISGLRGRGRRRISNRQIMARGRAAGLG